MALHRPAASSGNSRRDTPGGSARKELLLVPHAFHSLSFASSASSAHVPHALFHHASSGCHANGFHGSSTLCSEWRPVERMSQSQISRTICSVAQARHMPSTSWLSRCCSLLTCSHLKSMDPSLLADTLVALTQLDYHPGEDWMMDFDLAAVSHHKPIGPRATADILACMAALPGVPYRFPYFVACKLQTNVEEYEQHVHLSRVLRCLKHFNVELGEELLEAVGMRMGVLLAAMVPEDVHALMQHELGAA